MNQAVIEFKNVTKVFKIYHEKKNTLFEHLVDLIHKRTIRTVLKVLDNVSFSVNKGEMLGIIGQNGAGKTTMLRLMARI